MLRKFIETEWQTYANVEENSGKLSGLLCVSTDLLNILIFSRIFYIFGSKSNKPVFL